MAIQLQIRRGTTAENDVFTGAVGELTMDTETKGVRVHDGTTTGGIKIPTAATADYVVEWQMPTNLNGYTWYRKYKSGWVEQGGQSPISVTANTDVQWLISLPVTMRDPVYTAEITPRMGYSTGRLHGLEGTDPTQLMGFIRSPVTQSGTLIWQVSGVMA